MVVGDLAVSIPPLPTFQVSQVGQMALGEKLGNNAAAVVLKRERERERGRRRRDVSPSLRNGLLLTVNFKTVERGC